MNASAEYRYDRLPWPEIKAAITAQPCVIVPTGATEQHGPHLPLDVDAFLAYSVCLEAGRRGAGRLLVLPPVSYGLNLHHIDFPGTIHIEPETFIAFCLDITKSLAHHGFQKILLVNGHGSNTSLIDLVARKTVLQTNSLCAAVNYFALARTAFESVRETEVVAHADEMETSLYLHLAPERVRMDRAVRDDDVRGRYLSSDSVPEFPVRFNDFWGRWTTTGVHGDPTAATAAKGEHVFEAAVTALLELVDEWRAWPIAERRSQHDVPPGSSVRW